MTAAGGGITLDAASTATDKTITVPADNGTMALTSQLNGFRNRIINGAMMIDQRNAGASVTPTTSGTFSVDRWNTGFTQASKFSIQQSSTAPSGFSNSILVTSLSAYSVGVNDTFFVEQKIEGFNTADLAFGTASASTVTVSFWVRSSLTGTFGGALTNAATDYRYPFTFAVNSANTWEYKTVTIAGATSGTWVGSTNGRGMRVVFNLGSGSNYSGTANTWGAAGGAGETYAPTGATSVVGTNGATFYITGVQLEKGSVATGFDYRPYGTEMALCQRYFILMPSPPARGAFSGTNSMGRAAFILPVTMRATPSSTLTGTMPVYNGNTTGTITSLGTTYNTVNSVEFDGGVATGSFTSGTPFIAYNGAWSMSMSSEL
jgi:hypothetical protein